MHQLITQQQRLVVAFAEASSTATMALDASDADWGDAQYFDKPQGSKLEDSVSGRPINLVRVPTWE